MPSSDSVVYWYPVALPLISVFFEAASPDGL